MKKILLIITLLLFAIYYSGVAQTVTSVRVRQSTQHLRISQGVRTGELTRFERKALKSEQCHIRRVKRRAKSDGVLTRKEKRIIARKQNRAHRHIRKERYN